MLLAMAVIAEAQQAKKIPRIGYLTLSSSSPSSPKEAFRDGLRQLGYIEGQSIHVDYRYAEGNLDRLPNLAAELVRLKVDVIVAAGGIQAVQPAKNATSTIPIVMTGTSDPVATGLIASFARPGGNITGLTLGGAELYGKRLELLKETVPRISRMVFFLDKTSPTITLSLASNEMQTSARALGLQIQSVEVQSANDFADAFQAAVKGRAQALTVAPNPVFTNNRKQILEFAAKNRLPGIYPWREYVEDGGLMSYASDLSDRYRRLQLM